MNNNAKNEYLINLNEKEYKIYDEYTKLYKEYYNTNNEIEARKAGKNAERKAKEINTRDFKAAQASYGRFREWNVGTRFGNKLRQNRNRRRYEEESELINHIYFQSAQNFDINSSIENNYSDKDIMINYADDIEVAIKAIDDEIENNISKEKKAGRVLYDKKKELSKTLSASKAVTIDNPNNIIPQSEKKLPLIKIVINKVLELCFKNPTMSRGLRVIHITKLNLKRNFLMSFHVPLSEEHQKVLNLL